MRHLMALTATVMLAAALAGPGRACPLCKEAAESAVDSTSQEELTDDPLAEAKAYNRTIYLMIGVPYTLFAVGGFYCYRHLRGRQPAAE
jgi:hypothetical protein